MGHLLPGKPPAAAPPALLRDLAPASHTIRSRGDPVCVKRAVLKCIRTNVVTLGCLSTTTLPAVERASQPRPSSLELLGAEV